MFSDENQMVDPVVDMIVRAEFRKEVFRRREAGEPFSFEAMTEAMEIAMKNSVKILHDTELEAIEDFKNDFSITKEERAVTKAEWLADAEERIKMVAEYNTNPEYNDVPKEDKMLALEMAYSIKRALEAVEV